MANIGVIMSLNCVATFPQRLADAAALGLRSIQLNVWEPELYTPENAEIVKRACAETGMTVSALWAGWTGPCVWDFYEGQDTLGLVPPAYRAMRLEQLLKGSAFAELLGVSDMITHVGFLPENPCDPNFTGTVAALRQLCEVMKGRGQYFLFETGQETPVTLLRAIEAIGTGNAGVNLDAGNLILYGKAAPADAVLVLGRYIRNTHCKDGDYPTDGRYLGEEKALGQGQANYPLLMERLKACGYRGPLTIEREISGEQQIRDICMARDWLTRLWDN